MAESLVHYLQHMTKQDASDLFVTVDAPVSMKQHGNMVPLDSAVATEQVAEALVNQAMQMGLNQSYDASITDANFAIELDVGRFRVNVFRQRGNPGMVLRHIQTDIPKIAQLGLPASLKDFVMAKKGLIIMVGATGSGKSTSLAAMIDHRNHHHAGHILCIEDPIEFAHQHAKSIVTQREVGIDTDSFDTGLKNALREAPDVILIGEIRSRETMELAINFSETGHLCLATLHANNANQAVDRMINFFPEERHPQLFMDMSLNLNAIISQRLIPKKSGTGRVVAVEIMVNTPRVGDLVRKGEIHELKEVMKLSGEQGMQTFDQALFELYEAGEISYEEALHHADSENDLRLLIKLQSDNAPDQDNGMQGVKVLD